jgi:hypothetical protein
MADGCKERVMAVVLRRQGFGHADVLLNDIADRLADSLIRDGPRSCAPKGTSTKVDTVRVVRICLDIPFLIHWTTINI